MKMHYVDFDTVGVKRLCRDLRVEVTTTQDDNDTEEDVKLRKEGPCYEVFDVNRVKKMGGRGWTFERCMARTKSPDR